MIKNRLSEIPSKNVWAALAMVMVVAVLGGLRIGHYIQSPDVVFLSDRAGAHWIKYDSAFVLESKPVVQTECRFKYSFHTMKNIDNAAITVQALKQCRIFLDGVNIFSSSREGSEWKKIHDIKLPFAVDAGSHELMIEVISNNSPPAVIAYSDSLPVRTGAGWHASNDGRNWKPAVSVSQISPPEVTKSFPSSTAAFMKIWPFLFVVFAAICFLSLLRSRRETEPQKILEWLTEPSRVRWALMTLWAVLSVNNLFRLNFQTGPDCWGHIEYIEYIINKKALPLASDGWQMFQAPLNYILSAPLYALLTGRLDLPSIVKVMSIIPVVCGLLQIEIVYRVSRLVFADRKDLQSIAVVTGAVLPVHTYTCQFVGNEPLAGCLISLLVLLCIPLMMPDSKEKPSGYFVWIGIVWGLALLSKTTAVIFAPVLIFVPAFYTLLIGQKIRFTLKPVMIIFGVSALIAGWFYLRNWIKLGSPFSGITDQLQMTYWWQEPGYRTSSQLLYFGRSLVQPVYSGVTSFWDTLYSTLWLDGFNSGLIDFIPWNENVMIAGALLALLPGIFILTGIVSAGLNKEIFHRNAVLFSAGTLALLVIAMMDIYMIRTAYSVTKAGYTLGLLPCYAILVAAGAEPFLRNKIIRSFVLALFACWAVAAYAAYFVVKYQ